MNTKELFTDEQVSVLVSLVYLNDFHEGEYEEASFGEKFNDYDVSGLPDEIAENFRDIVDFWIEQGVFQEDEEELALTTKGEKLLSMISKIKGMSDTSIKNVMNAGKVLLIAKGVAVEHHKEIIELILKFITLSQ